MWLRFEPPQRADAQQIGAVFDAAVAEGWKYLGDLARLPMFPPEEWDKVVAEAAVWVVPCSLQTCEMYLLFVHPKHAARAAECVTCSRE